jgi:hypothetical protein
MLTDIILIFFLIGFCWYWFETQKIKAIAFNAVSERCLLNEVQLIDSYVALNGFQIKRDSTGTFRISSSFSFEFSSTGDDRYNGTLIMSGFKVESIYMQPHRIQ